MNPPGITSIVITDTSILINLSHTGHLALLDKMVGLRFVMPDEVVAEVTEPEQRRTLDSVIAAGSLRRESITSPDELAAFAELSLILGSGESACLALASSRGWLVACDEKRVFLREARNRLGDGRILNTPGLYVLWIRAGLLSVEEADAAKAILDANRFKTSALARNYHTLPGKSDPPPLTRGGVLAAGQAPVCLGADHVCPLAS